MSLQCNALPHIFSIMTMKIGMIVTMEMVMMMMINADKNDNDVVDMGMPG